MPSRKDRTQALAARSRFWMDDLHVQPDRCVVMRGDEEINLEQRMMEVLVELAKNGSKPVSPGALLKEFWSDEDGNELCDENPVTKTISALRRKIHDVARKPRYIKTINKHGYCIIPKVQFAEGYRHVHREFGTWTRGNPYVGLKSFDHDHAEVFQGRSATVADLMQAMREQIDNERRFVLIVGPSGCGKTSLIHASMIPTVSRQGGFNGLRALSVAVCDLGTASDGDVMTTLAASLAEWKLGNQEIFSLFPQEHLRKMLIEAPEKISAIIEEGFRRCPVRGIEEQPYAHLLLTIDHTETLVAARNITPEQRSRFALAIRALCDTPRIVTAMIARLDFYPALTDALPELADYRSGYGHFEVPTPSEGELAKIIRKPAALAGADFEEHPKTQVFLDDLLCKKAIAQPDALPLLQHTLHAMFERCRETGLLTYAAYDEIGGLEGAIARRAEEVFDGLSMTAEDDKDRILGRIFARIVVIQSDSGAVSASPIVRSRLDPEANQMAQAFIDAHLFVSDLDAGQPIVKVAHEALLRQWPRAARWIKENWRLLQARERLQRAAERWVKEGRSADHLLNPGRPLAEALEVRKKLPDEISQEENELLHKSEKSGKRKKLIRNIAIAALTISATSSTALSVFAFIAKNEAEASQLEAEASQQEVLDLIDYLLQDLAKQLRPQNNLRLLDSISNEALSILENRKIEDMSAIELVRHSQSLILIGEVSIKKGNNEDAIEAFSSALTAATNAFSKDKNSTEVINELGQVNYWIGYYHYNRNNFEKTEKYWKKYLEFSRELLKIDDDNQDWKIEKSYAINNLGTLYTDLGDYESALHLFKESFDIKKTVADAEDKNELLQIDLIDTLSWISRCHAFTGNLEKASEENQYVIRKLRELTDKQPKAYAWKRRLANALARSAEVESLKSNHATAEKLINESIQTLSELTSANGEDEEWRRDLAYAHMKAGDIALLYSSSSDPDYHYSVANEVIDQLQISASSKVEWKRLRSLIRVRYASTLTEKNQSNAISSAAVKELEELFKAHSSDYAGLVALVDALAIRANYREASGESQLSRTDRDRSTSIIINSGKGKSDPRLQVLLRKLNELAD